MLLEARLLDERREGKSEGIAKEKLATAKRLLSMGLSVQDVAKGTSLSVEQVENLKAEQK
jgi:predicted transposase/invertase (TIGR01784 family)